VENNLNNHTTNMKTFEEQLAEYLKDTITPSKFRKVCEDHVLMYRAMYGDIPEHDDVTIFGTRYESSTGVVVRCVVKADNTCSATILVNGVKTDPITSISKFKEELTRAIGEEPTLPNKPMTTREFNSICHLWSLTPTPTLEKRCPETTVPLIDASTFLYSKSNLKKGKKILYITYCNWGDDTVSVSFGHDEVGTLTTTIQNPTPKEFESQLNKSILAIIIAA